MSQVTSIPLKNVQNCRDFCRVSQATKSVYDKLEWLDQLDLLTADENIVHGYSIADDALNSLMRILQSSADRNAQISARDQ